MKILMFSVNQIAGNILTGRNTGDDIGIGDTFTRLFNSRLVREDEGVWSELREVCQLFIIVSEIFVYGKPVIYVPSGYVCQLLITGEVPCIDVGQIIGNSETVFLHKQRTEQRRLR